MTVRAYLRVYPEKEDLEDRRYVVATMAREVGLQVDRRLDEVVDERLLTLRPCLDMALPDMKPGDMLLTIDFRRLGDDMSGVVDLVHRCVHELGVRVMSMRSGCMFRLTSTEVEIMAELRRETSAGVTAGV